MRNDTYLSRAAHHVNPTKVNLGALLKRRLETHEIRDTLQKAHMKPSSTKPAPNYMDVLLSKVEEELAGMKARRKPTAPLQKIDRSPPAVADPTVKAQMPTGADPGALTSEVVEKLQTEARAATLRNMFATGAGRFVIGEGASKAKA